VQPSGAFHFYPEYACDFSCSEDNVEWNISYVSSLYNKVTDETTFTYQVYVLSSNPNISCNYHSTPSNLEYVFLRLSCDCEPESKSFLQSITKSTTPYATTDKLYWTFDTNLSNQDEPLTITIVINGNISVSDTGDVTLGGDGRCAQFSNMMVPNPCSNECNYGQWSDWTLYDNCTYPCGGGEQYRYRSCVSVCDGTTSVENCQGVSHGYVACNTQPCEASWSSSSSSSSSSPCECEWLWLWL